MALNPTNCLNIIGLFCLLLLQGACGRELDGFFLETKNAKSSIKNQSILYDGEITAAVPATFFRIYATQPIQIIHYAAYQSKEGTYNGVQALLDVYNLNIVNKDQLSSSQIWFSNGQNANLNSIQAGWHVFPSHYGDSRSHFFISWTSKGFQDGCYNLECPGFVLDRNSFVKPGDILISPSIFLKISKNTNTGDWWLFGNNRPIGYWPKRLFTTLGSRGTVAAFGGVVRFFKNQLSPPMGAGSFPDAGLPSAQIRNIKFINANGGEQYPFPADFAAVQDEHQCYRISPIVDSKLHDGYYFNYGGRGGCTS